MEISTATAKFLDKDKRKTKINQVIASNIYFYFYMICININ